jgi:hypothetical protein
MGAMPVDDSIRAPEHPAPAAVDDAVHVFGWARSRLGSLGAVAADGIGLAGTVRAAPWPRWPRCGCATRAHRPLG